MKENYLQNYLTEILKDDVNNVDRLEQNWIFNISNAAYIS